MHFSKLHSDSCFPVNSNVRTGRGAMANVYFVRQGTGESATNSGRELPLSSIASAFAGRNLIWSQGPPCFGDPLPANPVADFCYVVVHVENGERAAGFTKDGYWLLDGVSPTEFTNAVAQF